MSKNGEEHREIRRSIRGWDPNAVRNHKVPIGSFTKASGIFEKLRNDVTAQISDFFPWSQLNGETTTTTPHINHELTVNQSE